MHPFRFVHPARIRDKVRLLLFILVLTACGSESARSDGFEIRITGAYDTTLKASDGRQSLTRQSVEGMPSIYTFRFTDEGLGKAVTIAFYSDTAPVSGTYRITSEFGDDMEGWVTGLFVNREDNATLGQSEGTVTLTVEDGAYAGSFVFEAAGGSYGMGDVTVSVAGEFEGLALAE